MLRPIVMVTAALSAPALAAAACPSDHQVATELRLSLTRADAVWRGEADGVMGMAEVVRQSLVCVSTPLSTEQAATVHRTIGLTAAAVGDVTTAERVFAAAKSLQPDYPAPFRSVAGVEAVDAWGSATALPPLPPTNGDWLVDGAPSAAVPTDRPAVVQHIVDGDVIGTVWLDQGDPVPLTVACAELESRTSFTAALTKAQGALSHNDNDALSDSVDAAEGTLACLADSLSGNEVAHLLRLHGASQWVSGSNTDALPWLAAARALQPRYQFPSDVVPASEPLARAVYETLGDPVEHQRLPRGRGLILVNGSPSDTAPLNQPWVVQHIENGVPTLGALVRPGQAPPRWPGPLLRAPIASPETGPTRNQIRASTLALNIGAAALLGVGSGLWGGANIAIHTFCPAGGNGPRCPGDLGSRATTQRGVGIGLVVTGVALGGIGTGLTVRDLRSQ